MRRRDWPSDASFEKMMYSFSMENKEAANRSAAM
jgi:hypothetical protein